MNHKIRVKRIYDDIEEDDGTRLLVDRLWPRGIARERAHIDNWEKAIAPSAELRQWYHAHTDDYTDFKARYHDELDHNPEVVPLLDDITAALTNGNVTLLTASKLPDNNATALQLWVSTKLHTT